MPHYKDGTAAEVGDLVVGKSYNLNGHTIVGTVLEIIPGAESCNVRVAFVEVLTRPDSSVAGGGITYRSSYTADYAPRVIKPGYDYGETKAFALIYRPTGLLLPKAK